jgi:hypothetical protein
MRSKLIERLRAGIALNDITGAEDDMEAAAAHIESLETRIATQDAALAKIERWFGEFPETGEFWENTDGTMSDRPMSYASCHGSNGERDYMRSVARAAREATR